MLKHKQVGNIGESLAVMTLKNKGYEILAINFKTMIGEIDIVAKDKSYIVFVEVKARESLDFGCPREAVNSKKQQKIKLVATQYLKKYKKLDQNCRFDVIEIIGDKYNFKCEHLENAF